ncbi:MAG: SDR family oxidoreductase [Candidatus Eremiobacteraeota bacterium]|nr:SDR family oxidoreductase [Candidatus Eremiobacteraeota bacterium]
MEQQVVFITGASQGLGAELARGYARKGSGLVLTARTAQSLSEIQRELEAVTNVVSISGDVSDDRHVHTLVDAAQERFGRIDILINNASTLGMSPMPQLEKLGPNVFRNLMEVNVRAPLHLLQHILPGMRERASGSIVNVSSDAAVQAYQGWGGYGASKAALEHLSRILAKELAKSGVRVLVIDPGNMNTHMHREAEPGVDLSDLPHPKDVAPAVIAAIGAARKPFERIQAQAIVAGV